MLSLCFNCGDFSACLQHVCTPCSCIFFGASLRAARLPRQARNIVKLSQAFHCSSVCNVQDRSPPPLTLRFICPRAGLPCSRHICSWFCTSSTVFLSGQHFGTPRQPSTIAARSSRLLAFGSSCSSPTYTSLRSETLEIASRCTPQKLANFNRLCGSALASFKLRRRHYTPVYPLVALAT